MKFPLSIVMTMLGAIAAAAAWMTSIDSTSKAAHQTAVSVRADLRLESEVRERNETELNTRLSRMEGKQDVIIQELKRR